MNIKALALAASFAWAASPAFAAERAADLTAGKASIVTARNGLGSADNTSSLNTQVVPTSTPLGQGAAASVAEPQIYTLVLAGLGVAGLLLARRRPL